MIGRNWSVSECRPPPVTQADEVIEELSTHLEETYNDLLDRGHAPQAAFERTLEEAGDWDILFKGNLPDNTKEKSE